MSDAANSSDVADVLKPAVSSLMDAHELWHDAANGYHEPANFRRYVEALIQSLRNITWRLQAAKHDLPNNFDAWYGQWQEVMRRDRAMKWLNDARIEVTKRSGLKSASKASVRIVDSYLEPRRSVLSLPADTPTGKVLSKAIAAVPHEIRPHVAIEVARRWEIPALPGELLSTLAHCWHVLDALLLYVGELIAGGSPEAPDQFVETVSYPTCMLVDPSLITLTFEADTGQPYELDVNQRRMKVSPDTAARRYGLMKLAIDATSAPTLLELGANFHAAARRIFKKDGIHLPVLHLRTDEGALEPFTLLAEDKRDKFMQWRLIGELALIHRWDAYIFTTEMWSAPAPRDAHFYRSDPYPNVSAMPDRKEHLVTQVEAMDGTSAMWTSEIVRALGKGYLKKTRQDFVPKGPGFSSPLRRSWNVLKQQKQLVGRRSSRAQQHTDEQPPASE